MTPQTYLRTYRPSGAWVSLLLGCGGVLTDFSASGAVYYSINQHTHAMQSRLILAAIAILFFIISLAIVLDLKKTRLILHDDRIEIRKLTGAEVLFRHEIARWSLLPTKYGVTCLHLVPRSEARHQLKVPWIFKRDAAFDEWMSMVPTDL